MRTLLVVCLALMLTAVMAEDFPTVANTLDSFQTSQPALTVVSYQSGAQAVQGMTLKPGADILGGYRGTLIRLHSAAQAALLASFRVKDNKMFFDVETGVDADFSVRYQGNNKPSQLVSNGLNADMSSVTAFKITIGDVQGLSSLELLAHSPDANGLPRLSRAIIEVPDGFTGVKEVSVDDFEIFTRGDGAMWANIGSIEIVPRFVEFRKRVNGPASLVIDHVDVVSRTTDAPTLSPTTLAPVTASPTPTVAPTVSPTAPVDGDLCSTAVTLNSVGESLYTFPDSGALSSGVLFPPEKTKYDAHICAPDRGFACWIRDGWVKFFSPSFPGTMNIHTCKDTHRGDCDTLIAVYEGTCPSPEVGNAVHENPDPLPKYCNDDSLQTLAGGYMCNTGKWGSMSNVHEVYFKANTWYYIQVLWTNTDCMDTTVSLSVNPVTPAPTTECPTPAPTATPTEAPTPAPTQSPTPAPTPTPGPTNSPTPAPTPAPTDSPTPAPTPAPTDSPTPAPTRAPTPAPTQGPCTGGSSTLCHLSQLSGPGCNDEDCCVAVCENEEHCCQPDGTWDSACVDAAWLKEQCEVPWDECDNAKDLTSLTLPISEYFATWATGGIPLSKPILCGLAGSTVWYKWTNTGATSVRIAIDTCGATSFDTVIATFDACPQWQSERDQMTNCVNETPQCASMGSYVEVDVDAGDTVYIHAGGFFGAQGEATLSISVV